MMACGVIWLWIWGREHRCHPRVQSPGWRSRSARNPRNAYVHRDVDVVAVPRVDVHSVETGAGAIDDLEPLTLLHGQVDQQRAVRKVGKGLWRERGSGTWVGGGPWAGVRWAEGLRPRLP